jgi:4-aminobutyrate aminotransferase-like enzyme
MLDLSTNGELNPLGYNHRLFKAYAYGKVADNAIMNGFSADYVTSGSHQSNVRQLFNQIAPENLPGVTLVNERNATGAAVQHAMIERSRENNNGWSALYFNGSTHGSPLTLGGSICRWPHAAYPTSQNDESQILENVRGVAKERRNGASPLAAIVIEPTQQSTGYTARAEFIKNLRSIASDFEAALVVDETSTGCYASGQGHFWQYNGPADYVSFGKRTQVAGFFSRNDEIHVAGNENDVNLFNVILQGINEDNLS